MEYVYGALLLHKLGKPVEIDSLTKVVSAAGASVDEAKVKVLVTALKGVDIEKELASASLRAATPAGSGEAKAAAKEEKKEEKKEEAAEGLSALFG